MITPSRRINVSGARGETFSDVARRVGTIAGVDIPPDATDAQVMNLLTRGLADVVAAAGYTILDPARAAATGNVNVANPGTATFDEITLTNGQRLFLPVQTNKAQCGIYTFNGSGSALTRVADFDQTTEVVEGSFVNVTEGKTMRGSWVLVTADPITVGTTDQVWRPFNIRDITRADLMSTAAGKGAAIIASDDGAGGAKWTTVAGFIAYLMVGASRLPYLAADADAILYNVEKRLRNSMYFSDFGVVANGAANDAAAMNTAIAKAVAQKAAIRGTPNSIVRHNTGLALTGGYTTLIGSEFAPLANLGLPSFVLRTYQPSGAQLTVTGTSNRLMNIGVENYGGAEWAFKFNIGGHHKVAGISALQLAGTARYEALFYSAINALGYSEFTDIATDGKAVKYMFLARRTEAAPGETSGNNPMVVSHIREASSYTGGDHYGFYWDDAKVESVLCQYATWNQYGGILRGWDSTNSDNLMDWATNTAFQCVTFADQEIDFSTNVESDFFTVYNVAQFILDRATINLAGQPCLGVLRNSFADVRNVLMSSVNGPMWKILDLQSRVKVGQGNKLNKTNTGGYYNSTVAMPGCSCTVTTSTGSHQVTISNVTGRVEVGMPLVAAGPFNSFHVVREQRSGVAGGAGVYTLYARPLTSTTVIATQAAATYPTNSGIQIVPCLIDQFGDYAFVLEERLLEEGIEWFRLDIDASMVNAGVGRPFRIEIANNVASPTIFPVSSRTRGSEFGLMIRNLSGYALGAVTWTGIKKSDALALPANGKAMTMKLVNDVTVSGGVGTTTYMQAGAACSDITI